MARTSSDALPVQRHRRRRRTANASTALVFIAWIPGVVIATTSSTPPTPLVLGRDTAWWLQRVFTDEAFTFNGAHSDYSQQFFRLFLQGYTAPSLGGQLDLPALVANRIQDNNGNGSASFSSLSPMLQRAVLWDMGIVRAGDTSFTQVYTRCGFRMSELAISRSIVEAAGCVSQACSTTRGELFYQSLSCNGYQVGNVSRCATTRGKAPVHAAMWSDGGDDDTFPDTEVGKHEWNDTSRNYTIYGIHLKTNPNAYGKCIVPSMTVPCIAYEQLGPEEQEAWCEPTPSRLVTQWLQAESTAINERRQASEQQGAWGYILASGVIALALAVFLGVVWYRRKRKNQVRQPHGGNNQTTLGTDDVVSYFFTDEPETGDRRGIGRDPQTTAVLGASGCVTGFTSKLSSARLAGHPSDLVFVDDSFQHHDYEGFVSTRCGGLGSSALVMYSSGASSGVSHTTEYSANRSSDDDVVPLPHFLEPPEISITNTAATTVASSDWTASCSSRASTPTPLLSTPSLVLSTRSRHESIPIAAEALPTSLLSPLEQDPIIMAKRVPLIDVSVYRCLSKGAYGEIWIGRMRDQLVAVKRPVAERRRSVDDLEEFVSEICLMAKFQHRNILSLLGVAWNSPESLCMLVEFADRGDLQQLLKAKTSHELTWINGGRQSQNTDPSLAGKKTHIAMDVAAGLQYLHELLPSAVVHRDLKSKNIVLDTALVAKLCDFGVSRIHEHGADTMTCGVGTASWTAPEVLMGDKYTETADIYSFGVVLNELDTHSLPFHDVIDDATGVRMEMVRIMHLVCSGELTPLFTSQCPPAIRDLARDCLQFDSTKRPPAREVLQRLRVFFEKSIGVDSVVEVDVEIDIEGEEEQGHSGIEGEEDQGHSFLEIRSSAIGFDNVEDDSVSRESRADSTSSDSSGWV